MRIRVQSRQRAQTRSQLPGRLSLVIRLESPSAHRSDTCVVTDYGRLSAAADDCGGAASAVDGIELGLAIDQLAVVALVLDDHRPDPCRVNDHRASGGV